MKNCRACLTPEHCDCLCSTCTAARMRYDEHNVTRGVKDNGENPGYFYAPCRVCGKRINVGNNPPVIIDGRLEVWCFPECKEVVMSRSDYLDYKYGGK